MAQQDELLRKIEELKEYFDDKISVFVDFTTFETTAKNLKSEIGKIVREVKTDNDKIISTQRKINEAFCRIDTKIDKEEFETENSKLWSNFNKYWPFNFLSDLKGEIIPNLERFITEVKECQIEWKENKEIIRRFDEVIWAKASKFAIDELR